MAQPADLLLWEGEVDIDRIEGLQRDDRVSLAKDLTEIYLPDADSATEGCADRLFRDCSADAVRLGNGLLVVCNCSVVV